MYSEIIPFLLILLLLGHMVYMERQNRKERAFHLHLIDRLQNKLMAKDLTEYTLVTKDRTGRTVTNPLMSTIDKNNKARYRDLHGEENEDG